jgi:branched-chain amino acid transport system permease protein
VKSNDESERAVEAGDVGSAPGTAATSVPSPARRAITLTVGAPGARRGQGIRSNPATGAVLVALGAIVLIVALGGNYYSAILVLALSYCFVTLGMAVQTGYSSQLVLWQSAFMGLGAYGVAALSTKYGIAVSAAIAIMMLVGAALGLLLGLVLVRAVGLAIALATLFVPLIISSVIIYWSYVGASVGLGGVPSIITRGSAASSTMWSGAVAAVLLGVCVFVCGRIIRSGVGLELALMGSDAGAAQAVGVGVRRRKLELFVLGSGLAALGGGVFAGTQAFVSPTSFDQTAELTLLVMLFLGGRRSIYGALLGTIALELLAGISNYVSLHLLTIEGVLFTVVLLLAPDGLLGLGARAVRAAVRTVSQRGLQGSRLVSRDSGAREHSVSGAPDMIRPSDMVPPPETSTTPRLDSEPSTHRAASATPKVLALEVRGLTKRFGGVVAVDGATMQIPALGVHAIVGPNGAGKSTFFDLVAGATRPDAGRIMLFGKDVTDLSAAKRAKLGVARTFQAVRLVETLSVLDNVAVAAVPSHDTAMARAVLRSDLGEARAIAQASLDELGIGELSSRRPGELTLEGQRMTELARAIVSQSTVLMLDEPASGLSVEQRHRLADTLCRLAEDRTVVIVEHDLALIDEIADQVVVLMDGRVAYDGPTTGFREHPEVRTHLLGLADPVEMTDPEHDSPSAEHRDMTAVRPTPRSV